MSLTFLFSIENWFIILILGDAFISIDETTELINFLSLSTDLSSNIYPVSPTINGKILTLDTMGIQPLSIDSQSEQPNPSKLDNWK